MNKISVGADASVRKEKGITLVALVITIIVLIILVGVSIKSVMNGGLIINAKGAKEKWSTSKTEEEGTLNSLIEKIEGKHVESESGQITIQESAGENLKNYRIYGKSVQEGTPTLGNPVEIQSVGDKIENLLDKSVYGLSDTKKVINTKKFEDIAFPITEFKENVQYTFMIKCKKVGSKQGNSESSAPQATCIFFKYTDGTVNGYSEIFAESTASKTEESTKVFTSVANKTISNIYFGSYFYDDFEIENIGFYEGNITIEDTKQEGKYKIPINTINGENIFTTANINKKPETKVEYNGTTYECYAISGYGSSPKEYSNKTNFQFDINLEKGKTYTISLVWLNSTAKDNRVGILYMPFMDENGNSQCFMVNGNPNIYNAFGGWYAKANPLTRVKFTITPTENIVAGELAYYNAAASGYILKDSIQIVEGTEIKEDLKNSKIITTIYLDEPLRGIGDYADYIDLKQGKVVRNIHVIDKNNISFDWFIINQAEGNTAIKSINIPITELNMKNTKVKDSLKGSNTYVNSTNILTTHFKASIFWGNSTTPYLSLLDYQSDVWRFAFNFKVTDFGEPSTGGYLKKDNNDTFKLFNNWFKESGFELYYPCESYEQDIDLPSIPTYAGTTNIIVNTNIVPSKIEVNYE